jgi:hypothetical protein
MSNNTFLISISKKHMFQRHQTSSPSFQRQNLASPFSASIHILNKPHFQTPKLESLNIQFIPYLVMNGNKESIANRKKKDTTAPSPRSCAVVISSQITCHFFNQSFYSQHNTIFLMSEICGSIRRDTGQCQ